MPTASWLAAGVLQAEGSLGLDLTEDEVVEILYEAIGNGSVWCPGRRLDEAPIEAARGPMALWEIPDMDELAARERVLERAWQRAVDLATSLIVDQTDEMAVRLIVRDLDTRDILFDGVDDWTVVAPLVPRLGGDLGWQWPLDIAIVDGPDAARWRAELDSIDPAYHHLFEVTVVAPEAVERDQLVVAGIDQIDLLPPASTLVVIGDGVEDFAELAARVEHRRDGVLLLSRISELGWLGPTILELSHDYPLDAAVAKATNHVAILADPTTMGFTSVRAHAEYIADRLADLVDLLPDVGLAELLGTERSDRSVQFELMSLDEAADRLRDVAYHGRFDRERGSGTDVAAGGELLAAAADRVKRGDHVHWMAAPRAAAVGQAQSTEHRTTSEDRRLQVRLRDEQKQTLLDSTGRGTLREGQVVRLSAAIASKALPGAVGATESFPPGGRDLEILIHIDGVEEGFWAVPLTLPKHADSAFTKEVAFDCPPIEVHVRIVVLAEGRSLQTATFLMPVDVEEAQATLTIDQPGPLSDAWRRRVPIGALACFPQQDGPMLVATRGPANPRTTPSDEALDEVRNTLTSGFGLVTTSLEGLSRPLAELARLGRSLHIAIGGDSYADVGWIHLVDFASADIPLELTYDRDIGPREEVTGMCPEGAAGATTCGTDCSSRGQRNLVCPNGFWGVSKVIERRAHVSNRLRRTSASRRRLPIRGSAAVGYSQLMNEVNGDAGDRMVNAVRNLASQTEIVASWDALTSVADSGLIVLAPHTEKLEGVASPDDIELELRGHLLPVLGLTAKLTAEDGVEPGPLVLLIGCETGSIYAGFARVSEVVQSAGAEAVVTALSSVPGGEVARFIATLSDHLVERLESGPGGVSLAEVMRDVRRAALREGNLVGLAVTMVGDGEVVLIS